MNAMVLAALRRKRETAERAGLTDRVKSIDARIAKMERAERSTSQQVATATATATAPETEEATVEMTAAARQRADELGLTAADFKRRRASGRTGFTVDDVERIAASRGEGQTPEAEET